MNYSADEQFVAEISMFGFNFAPRGWATCDGQLLPLSQNTALFSLLGTNFGGDGRATFGLPNLQDSVPIHWGQGPNLTDRYLGETGGSSQVVLIETELPQHAHVIQASIKTGTGTLTANAIGTYPATTSAVNLYSDTASASNIAPLNMDVNIAPAGSGFPHNNTQPFLTVTFCIALQGIFPARS